MVSSLMASDGKEVHEPAVKCREAPPHNLIGWHHIGRKPGCHCPRWLGPFLLPRRFNYEDFPASSPPVNGTHGSSSSAFSSEVVWVWRQPPGLITAGTAPLRTCSLSLTGVGH